MSELEVRAADGTTRKIALAAGAVSLGRAEECDVVLAEGKASRRHCRVEPCGGGWRVVDEGSSNGTWVGGRPVFAVRLRQGDEIKIGETIITFNAGDVVSSRDARRPRGTKKPGVPWGILALPVIVGVAAVLLVGKMRQSAGADEAAAWKRYAAANVERAALQKDRARADAILAEARAQLERREHAADALSVLAGPAPAATPATGAVPKSAGDWAAAIAALDAAKDLPAAERRSRLADLLERHVADPAATEAIRERIRVELTSVGEKVRLDREQTFTDADKALAESRYGDALVLWQSYLGRAQSVSPQDDAAIAQRLLDIIAKARVLAQQAADESEKLRAEGRAPAAQAGLEAAIEKLRGTGFDEWLAARGGVSIERNARGAPTPKADDPALIEMTRARAIQAAGEELARQRQFGPASAKLAEAAGAVHDKGMSAALSARAGDLKDEAAFFAKLLADVAKDPKTFSPLTLSGHGYRIASATPTEITVLGADGNPEPHAIAEIPSSAFVQLTERDAPQKADLVSAALLMNELNERTAYTHWMLLALAVPELQPSASEVHSRCIGRELPINGYLPHPGGLPQIVTSDESKRIQNEKKIADLTGKLSATVDALDKTKQAKAVEGVRRTYLKLETARKHALDLIFDEVRYFYPYRGKEKEYMPVQHEVDELVKAVRDLWEDPTPVVKVRGDAALEKLLKDAENFVTEILFYGGMEPGSQAESLQKRVETLKTYLGKDLTVRTFFETPADETMRLYNEKVMKFNLTAKGPTEPEREQVRITNEYRMMFGHRRALRINAALVTSSRGHSDDMSKGGFFDHFDKINPGKYSPEDRMKLAGYDIAGGSENIYQGSSGPEAAHAGWIHSSGHHRNILTPAWVEMGSGLSGNDWTQNFGFRATDDWEGGVPK